MNLPNDERPLHETIRTMRIAAGAGMVRIHGDRDKGFASKARPRSIGGHQLEC
jgi:hypothetical protein